MTINKQLDKQPKIGVAVIIKKDDKVLLGKRMGSHGADAWGFPGGHLEFGETVEQCASREAQEETDLKVKNIKFATFTDDFFKDDGKHYVTLFTTADYGSGEVKIMEPDKCKEWRWFEWGELPEPLFLPIENLLTQKYSPFE